MTDQPPDDMNDALRRMLDEFGARQVDVNLAGEVVGRNLPPPGNPSAVARLLVNERFSDAEGNLTLRHWRDAWLWWRTSHWAEVEDRAMRQVAYSFTEHASYDHALKDSVEQRDWSPTTRKVTDLLDALKAVVHTDETHQQPAWLGDGQLPAGAFVACRNGLLHVETRALLAHTPLFFNQTAVPFDYNPNAPPPVEWLDFLSRTWPNDEKAIQTLQEWFGYVISGQLHQHKILLWVGPTRGGKGVTARILTALVGADNVAGPTLDSLGTDFGLAPLLGKPLAVVSDVRLSGRSTSSVVERLLNISGEDSISVNRKYRDPWTGKLPTRFFLISNELPGLGDASMAVVGRFVILLSNASWLGKEDYGLETRLRSELAGILNWALDGLERLTKQGHFTVPDSTAEAITTLQDLASPVAGFLREECEVGPEHEIHCDTLYAAWKAWAESNGNRVGSIQSFGRNLRAARPSIKMSQARDGATRYRFYQGVKLRSIGTTTTDDRPTRVEASAEGQPGHDVGLPF